MTFPLDHHTGNKADVMDSETNAANVSAYQQPNQMRNDYNMHPPSSSDYRNQRYHHGSGRLQPKEEVNSYRPKPNFQQYYTEDETYLTPRGQQQVEGRTDTHPSDDVRLSNNNVQSSLPRDGPSPGRNYSYSNKEETMYQREKSSNNVSRTNKSPFRSTPPSGMSNSKRKGPRLISNQSSDDSINALLPSNKKARLGAFFPSDSFLKSFTLSPMNSRTFSREEPIEMPRFAGTKGSAEGSHIFHSWSSGNSRSKSHPSVDVRNCYDDWHLVSMGGRQNNFMSNGYNRPIENAHDYEHRDHPHTLPLSQQGSWKGVMNAPDTKLLNQYQGPPQSRNGGAFDSNTRQLQPLHPEDRYNEQLFQGYSQGADMNSTHWRNQGPPMPQLYSSQRRDDIENRSLMMRGTHHQTTASNGWARYGGDHHHAIYDPHNPVYPNYDQWGQPVMRGAYDGHYNQSIPTTEAEAPSYYDRLTHLKSLTVESGPNGATGMRTADGILLLCLPEDRISLSETLCIVRENVEVFSATEADVKAPAPGRKRPVIVGQVGLRCIHCRAATHQSEKVKRAVCFPSSVKRIYRTVIDMKLDHFKACRFVPIELKLKLEELRATNARSTGTTMTYFLQAAKRMGMSDGGNGICFETQSNPPIEPMMEPISNESATEQQTNDASAIMRPLKKSSLKQQNVQSGVSFTLSLDLSMSDESGGETTKGKESLGKQEIKSNCIKAKGKQFYEGRTLLAMPEDKTMLSPLRCFLRENVCVFSATYADIAVRTPTTFSVELGQVGIACIHCLKLHARERSNRAVCFPYSIGRIYQSVADIQRFHFSECKMVPQDVRDKFMELQNASSKGSKGLATRSYWVSSAKKLGLVDTDKGIRFSRDPSAPLENAKSLDILAQVAQEVTTAAQPIVLPEDEPLIAGFLYLVMKQLQPCRFTEADKNKRRLKDVGCIGVECKHCAGQVDSRKFFWSSVNAVESNFVSVHTHMMECKMINQELKDKLAHLKTLRKEDTAKLKSGSQKAFFSRVWERLHKGGKNIPSSDDYYPSSPIPSSPDEIIASLPSPVTTMANHFDDEGGSPAVSMLTQESSALNSYEGKSISPNEESTSTSTMSSPTSTNEPIDSIDQLHVQEENSNNDFNISVIEEI